MVKEFLTNTEIISRPRLVSPQSLLLVYGRKHITVHTATCSRWLVGLLTLLNGSAVSVTDAQPIGVSLELGTPDRRHFNPSSFCVLMFRRRYLGCTLSVYRRGGREEALIEILELLLFSSS